MAVESQRVGNGLRPQPLPGTGLVRGLFARVFAVADGAIGLGRATASAISALPRIAVSLERLASLEPTLRELSQLRGAIGRIEQLGTFVAEELPESLHQLERVRVQLGLVATRLADVNHALLNLTLTPRELDRVLRDVADTLAPLENVANRLENLAELAPARERRKNQRPERPAGHG